MAGKIKPGTRSAETISLTDMLAIIGKELLPGAGPDSYNVLPALLGHQLPDPERPLVMTSGGIGVLSIRAGKWKLIEGQGNCGYAHFVIGKPKAFFANGKPMPEPKPGDHPAKLYDLEEDLGETNNLYTQHPEVVHRLKQHLEATKSATR